MLDEDSADEEEAAVEMPYKQHQVVEKHGNALFKQALNVEVNEGYGTSVFN